MSRAVRIGRTTLPWLAALTLAAALGAPGALFQVPLDRLADARQARDDRIAAATAPAIVVPAVAAATESFAAKDGRGGLAAAQASIRRMAAKAGVLVERLDASAPGGPDQPLRLHLRASGSEKAVLGFADELQTMNPVLALPAWDVSSEGGAQAAVRLDAQILSAWHEAR